MFSKQTYLSRRNELKRLVGSGVIILFGNNESPCNYPSNAYSPFRQDSSFLYYFGLARTGLVGVIDVDNDSELLFGDDIDIEDIVWYGSVDSVSQMAASVGVAQTAPMSALSQFCSQARAAGRTLHFLPPYRHDTMLTITDLLGIHHSRQRDEASLTLIRAVVKMRSSKTAEEVAELEKAAAIGYQMHTTAMRLARPGVTEKYVGGQVDGIARSLGAQVSFATIFSQHGEIMHGNPSMALLEEGRLALCDAGAETMSHYCSDNTRTFPVSGRFTERQLDIYRIVEECHDYVLTVARPGVCYRDVHFGVCRLMTERLKELGLMRGNTDDAVSAGAHAMFLPHGLGHMMGMDVHDTNALRMGRRLEEGFVVTDEPGIYFIPALIDDWKASGHCKEFLNFDLLETYKDFGGIRIEDDVLITADGCRFIGEKRIPYHPADVEQFLNE